MASCLWCFLPPGGDGTSGRQMLVGAHAPVPSPRWSVAVPSTGSTELPARHGYVAASFSVSLERIGPKPPRGSRPLRYHAPIAMEHRRQAVYSRPESWRNRWPVANAASAA